MRGQLSSLIYLFLSIYLKLVSKQVDRTLSVWKRKRCLGIVSRHQSLFALLFCLLQLVLEVNPCKILVLIIGMLSFVFKGTSKRLQDLEVYAVRQIILFFLVIPLLKNVKMCTLNSVC